MNQSVARVLTAVLGEAAPGSHAKPDGRMNDAPTAAQNTEHVDGHSPSIQYPAAVGQSVSGKYRSWLAGTEEMGRRRRAELPQSVNGNLRLPLHCCRLIRRRQVGRSHTNSNNCELLEPGGLHNLRKEKPPPPSDLGF